MAKRKTILEEEDFAVGEEEALDVDAAAKFPRLETENQGKGVFGCEIGGCFINPPSFDTSEEFEAHYDSEHRHVCSICHRVLLSDRYLSLHVSEVHDSYFKTLVEHNRRAYECFVDRCPRTFKTLHERKHHLIDIHSFPPDYDWDVVLGRGTKSEQRFQWKRTLKKGPPAPIPDAPINERMRGPHKNKAAHEQIARQVTSLMKNIENGTDEVNGSIPIKTDDVGSEDVHTVPKERAGPNRRERRRMMREQKDANNESIAEGSSADVPMVDGSTNDMATSVDTNSNSMNTDEIGEDIDPQCHTAESSASHRRRPRKRGGVKKKRSKPFPLQHDDADVDGEDVPDRSSSQAGNTGEDTTMDELCGSMKQLEIPSSVRFGGASKMFVNLRDGGPQPHGGRPWNFGSVKTLYMETSRKQRGNEV